MDKKNMEGVIKEGVVIKKDNVAKIKINNKRKIWCDAYHTIKKN
jgi:hypothetical protein